MSDSDPSDQDAFRAANGAGPTPDPSRTREGRKTCRAAGEAGRSGAGKMPPPNPKRPPRHDEWTRPKMVAFLRELAALQSVSQAAKSVGMSRQSAYKLRDRMPGTPFALAWEVALESGLRQLAHAAMDRAVNGVEQPHYYHGKLVGTTRKYDNRLAIWLLENPWKVGRQQLSREQMAAEWEVLLERIEWDGDGWYAEGLAATEELLSEEQREELKDPLKRLEAESWYLANLPRRARR